MNLNTFTHLIQTLIAFATIPLVIITCLRDYVLSMDICRNIVLKISGVMADDDAINLVHRRLLVLAADPWLERHRYFI